MKTPGDFDNVSHADLRARDHDATLPAKSQVLVDRWQVQAPRSRAPQVIARPSHLDAAIGKVFTRAYRYAWHRQMHTLLVAEGTAALARLATRGAPPLPPLPRDRSQAARLYEQITADSLEDYLTRHGWQPLDHTVTVRRWHNGADTIVEVPTSRSGTDQRAALQATAYILAEQEQREVGVVLIELTDPRLRDPHLARVHTLLTRPPTVSDAQVAGRLATARVATGGGEVPLADLARYQIETLGASDIVWKVATAAGEADAAAQVAQLLGSNPAEAPATAGLFAHGPADPPEEVAARIWVAGAHLPPAQHARWFAHTWWPYHVTRTTRTVTAFLAARCDHQPPASLPTPGGPGRDLFKAIDIAAMPDRSSQDRFVAAYRLVDAAVRPHAVQCAARAVRDQLTHGQNPAGEAVLATALVHAGDPRRFAHPPSDAALRAALAAAWPAGAGQPPTPATGHPPSSPPPQNALTGTGRSRTPGGSPLVVDPTRHRQRQLVTTAACTLAAGLVPTPPSARAAPVRTPRR